MLREYNKALIGKHKMNDQLIQAKKNYSDAKARDTNSQHQDNTSALLDKHDTDETYKNKAIDEWNSSASIRNEFVRMSTYVAFRKAELKGCAHICSKSAQKEGS